ncbi:MAG: sulfatase-like hydrolase/transferase [Paludibacteraceae bacterium]|nr:sulfatase-like hydrolase/transferase [Paludibacteraceae bacterium]
MKRLITALRGNVYAVVIINLILAMLIYTLCRLEFYLVNKADFFPEVADLRTIFLGGLKFDLTAVLYSNIVYIAMMIIPFKFRYGKVYQKVAKWLFIVVNSICVIINLSDSVYFKFTGRRTTMSFFSEFQNDNNLLTIMGEGIVQYWYVSLTAVVIIAICALLYFRPDFSRRFERDAAPWIYYVRNTIAMAVAVFFIVNGMRGGFGSFVRPITLSNANAFVNKPLEASIVLNTPFCMMRTIGNKPYNDPKYFKSEEEADKIFRPVITPHPNGEFKRMNVVVFILESFSKEFVGELNKDLDGGNYKGFTPFLDSLIQHSLTFEYTFANGRKSIDAMPSVLSSIPRFYEPYFLTEYSNNKVSGIAGELDKKGYYTAFFHGAPNGSMGFEAFAKVTGFKDYYGMTEYGNDSDYDGTWAIWDEEFFQFFANKMGTFKEPFMTALFSASSHHPFHVPEKYKDIYKEDGIHPLHKCIRYSDNALRKFFDNAKKQPWYNNTLFVITADHTNALTRKEYTNDAGNFKVPIIFYTPNGDLKGRLPEIAEQIDVMPTVLGYLNYDEPYLAFGHDLLDSTYTSRYAINHYDQTFQFFQDSLMYQFDGKDTKAVYNFVTDIYLQNNLLDKTDAKKREMVETKMKAIIQQYINRMTQNRLTYPSENDKK